LVAPHHQQCFSRPMQSSNQISSVHFFLDSVSSFDWKSAQELENSSVRPNRSLFLLQSVGDENVATIVAPRQKHLTPTSRTTQSAASSHRLLFPPINGWSTFRFPFYMRTTLLAVFQSGSQMCRLCGVGVRSTPFVAPPSQPCVAR
jgi:hypothetical protein